MKRERRIRGSSMMETMVVLAVIAILVATFGTALYSITADARKTAALNQLDRVKKGLVGEARVVPTGEKDVRRFGFIGDLGTLPSSLTPLTTIGSFPDYRIDPLLQMGAGWRGPYEPVLPSDV